MADFLHNYVNFHAYDLTAETLEYALAEESASNRARLISETVDSIGRTSLIIAIFRNNLPLLVYLLDSLEQSAICRLIESGNGMHIAADHGHSEVVTCVLQSVSSELRQRLMKFKNFEGQIALHYAIRSGHTETVKCMLKELSEGAMYEVMQVRSDAGSTAFHYGALGNNADIMNCLLLAIPSQEQRLKLLSIQDNKRQLPIDCAAKHVRPFAMKCIVNSISREQLLELMELEKICGNPVLHFAAFAGCTNTIKCMLQPLTRDQRYKLIKMTGRLGITAMHTAAWCGHIKTIQCMVDSVSTVKQKLLLDMRDMNNQTALEIVLQKGLPQAADLIAQWRLQVEARCRRHEGTLQNLLLLIREYLKMERKFK